MYLVSPLPPPLPPAIMHTYGRGGHHNISPSKAVEGIPNWISGMEDAPLDRAPDS